MLHSASGMGRRVKVMLGAVLAAVSFASAGCLAEAEGEDIGAEAQEVASGRCADTRARATATVKVMTINVRHDSDQWERRFSLIADEIARLDPDLIGLQEVEIARDQADRLNELLAKRGHAKYHVYTKRKSGLGGFFTGEGISVMSRWPIVEKHHEDIGKMRVSIVARVEHPAGGFIDMANTHLDHKGGAEGDATRDDQAKQTLELLDRNDDCYPTFLTGDMNATENSAALTRFKSAGFVDSYRQVHGAATPETGNTSTIVLRDGAFTQDPKRRIDFVLGRSAGGRTVKALDSVVCFKNHDAKGFYPSDHLGVMTTYEVRF
jgi:beta-glucosidase